MRSVVLSLLLALAVFGSAQTSTSTRQQLDAIKSEQDVLRFIDQVWPDAEDYSVSLIRSSVADKEIDWKQAKSQLREILVWHEVTVSATPAANDPKAQAIEIKQSPFYRDAGEKQTRNWLARGFQRIGKWLSDFLERIFGGDRNLNLNPSGPNLGFLSALTPVIWVLFGLAIATFLFFIIRRFSIQRRSKIGGLMEDDEPERTADEWVTRAQELAAAGRHREAVRCLYLACLVRFDDGNVARFIRSETNWEHLARIHASSKLPAGLDFRTPTQRFDLIWYGHQPTGQGDVDWFLTFYAELCERLNIQVAA